MRWCRKTRSKLAAGAGIAALACNAAIPVVLAFLLAAALGPTRHEWVRLGNGEWLYYGPQCGHDGGNAGSEHRKSRAAPCPVCSLQGTLALALSAPVAAPLDPLPIALPRMPAAAIATPASTFSAGYRPRAPPIA